MKFEEVLILIRNDGKKLEDFEHLVLSSGEWVQFSEETFTSWKNLIKKEFRLKSKKIKRYQVLFLDENNEFCITSSKSIRYSNKEEFDLRFKDYGYKFHSLILDSEKEYDE